MDLGTFQAQKRGNNRNNNNNRGKQPFYSTSQNKQNGDWKRNATCHFCGKKGHIKPDCRAYQAQQSRNPKGGASGKPAGQRGQLSLAEQVAELTAQLAAMKGQQSQSKN